MATRITVPARSGKAVKLDSGDRIRIISTSGTQVVDFWAITLPDGASVLSMAHTRSVNRRIVPHPGDNLIDTDRVPMMRLVEDISPGVHDTLINACTPQSYRDYGVEGFHDSCANNYRVGLADAGFSDIAPPHVPPPFNLFMNVPWDPDGALDMRSPVTKPGDSVLIEALRPCVVALSACPFDVVPLNGPDGSTFGFDFEVISAH